MDTAYITPKCGLPPRVLFGKGPKENRDGYHSMYKLLAKQSGGMNLGPGAYPLDMGYGQTKDRPPKWSMSKLGRDNGSLKNKVPGPGTYKDDAFKNTLPRLQFGKLLKGQKCKSMGATGSGLGPGQYNHKPLERHNSAPSFQRSASKNESRPLPKKDAPGPGAYNPDYKHVEGRNPRWGLSKDKSVRFTEAAANAKLKMPPPGKYDMVPVTVETRGTKWSQLHGVGRSSLHGTF
jgi:hypothetical protein